MYFFFQAEDGIRDYKVTGVQTCALPIQPYWYKINGQRVSKDAYIKYENKPGGDEAGKQTNDPDAYGNKANNHGRGKKTK